MTSRRFAVALLVVIAQAASFSARAADLPGEAYDLTPAVEPGDVANVQVSLEVGGELIVANQENEETRLPMSVVAKLAYDEQLLAWSDDPADAVRSLRRYREAKATIKTKDIGVTRQLPLDCGLIVAEVGEQGAVVNGLDRALTRDQYDLINVIGNTLAADRLLPKRRLKESEGWDHDASSIGAVTGMDHVALCEVRSVVTGMENRQVQIRLAGVVHGTVDGAASEMDLRGAYLFHLDERRITKLNLAVKEVRKAGEVSPGLDVVAKLSLVRTPLAGDVSSPAFQDRQLSEASSRKSSEMRQLRVESPQRGYRFLHDASWFVTSEQRETMSLRLMDDGDMLAHCNVTTLPARPKGAPLTLQQFEKNVVESLGDKLGEVKTASEWANVAGHQCLGVIAVGTVDDVPVQWRYYFVADEGKRPTTIAVTLEQTAEERFADADRAIVDSLTLLDAPAVTAAKSTATKK